jgi:uncharacterized membrane protein
MALVRPSLGSLMPSVPRPGTRLLSASVDVQAAAETTFSQLCEIEKWPVWLSFLRSAQLVNPSAVVGPGTEIALRFALPAQEEQLFEIDHFITNHHLSLVGAYSIRRRLDFRLERKTSRCKLHARLEYPAYGGRLGALYDSLRSAGKLAAQLDESLTHFKHLAEYDHTPKDELLADF